MSAAAPFKQHILDPLSPGKIYVDIIDPVFIFQILINSRGNKFAFSKISISIVI